MIGPVIGLDGYDSEQQCRDAVDALAAHFHRNAAPPTFPAGIQPQSIMGLGPECPATLCSSNTSVRRFSKAKSWTRMGTDRSDRTDNHTRQHPQAALKRRHTHVGLEPDRHQIHIPMSVHVHKERRDDDDRHPVFVSSEQREFDDWWKGRVAFQVSLPCGEQHQQDK